MTKQEVNKLLALMKANYSYAFKSMSQQDKYLLLNTWTFTLQDLNADVVMIAAMQLISASKWLPIFGKNARSYTTLRALAGKTRCNGQSTKGWQRKSRSQLSSAENRHGNTSPMRRIICAGTRKKAPS